MNKAGVIDAVAKSLDCSKSSADVYVNTILETIKEGVRDTGKVQLMGFGTFEARQTKAREGRNPRTGEPMMIKASTRCAFKVGKQFKEMLCAKTLETAAAAVAATGCSWISALRLLVPPLDGGTILPAMAEAATTAGDAK